MAHRVLQAHVLHQMSAERLISSLRWFVYKLLGNLWTTSPPFPGLDWTQVSPELHLCDFGGARPDRTSPLSFSGISLGRAGKKAYVHISLSFRQCSNSWDTQGVLQEECSIYGNHQCMFMKIKAHIRQLSILPVPTTLWYLAQIWFSRAYAEDYCCSVKGSRHLDTDMNLTLNWI